MTTGGMTMSSRNPFSPFLNRAVTRRRFVQGVASTGALAG